MEDKKEKVLIVEDETKLARFVELELKHEGYEVFVANDGRSGIESFFEHEPDIILLDLMLPQLNGIEVCRRIRKESSVPIIMLTAKGEVMDKVLGLDNGADDYITKPFKLGELCSRIRALLRRAGLSTQGTGAVMECGDIKIDLLGSRVLLKGKILELTAAEYRLICLLVKNANRIITRDIILDELWDSTGDYVDNNTLSVYVRRLREKIETDPSHPEHLLTVRGFGYQWKEVDE